MGALKKCLQNRAHMREYLLANVKYFDLSLDQHEL